MFCRNTFFSGGGICGSRFWKYFNWHVSVAEHPRNVQVLCDHVGKAKMNDLGFPPNKKMNKEIQIKAASLSHFSILTVFA